MFEPGDQLQCLCLLVVVMVAGQGGFNRIVGKKNPCSSGVFSGNQVHFSQGPNCPESDIFEISNGSRNDMEGSNCWRGILVMLHIYQPFENRAEEEKLFDLCGELSSPHKSKFLILIREILQFHVRMMLLCEQSIKSMDVFIQQGSGKRPLRQCFKGCKKLPYQGMLHHPPVLLQSGSIDCILLPCQSLIRTRF